jgi:hypothetical protein
MPIYFLKNEFLNATALRLLAMATMPLKLCAALQGAISLLLVKCWS